ncbi:MAG: exo-alpha-sialidase [Kiritimatiellae bacterium]|nr:exo-alpha-sialidase [Kiritimatiellia bacterium]
MKATCAICVMAAYASAAAAEVTALTVETGSGYSSWPMIQAVGDRLVCAYSRGTAHDIVQGVRDALAKWSADGGRTWSQPVAVAASPEYGETPIGKGLDETGAALFWVRAYGGRKPHHALYRTTDGERFELLATPELSPLPVQITDVFHVPGRGLVALWFAGSYGDAADKSWGEVVSTDGGRTWRQRTIEKDLPKREWPTEPSVARLPDGRLLCIARSEILSGEGACQWQMESTDGGLSWTRTATNIRDVFASTPSLLFDAKSNLLYNYYYERGKGTLKRRVAKPNAVVGHPLAWPEPEVVARGSDSPWDAGNANATSLGKTHYVAYYSGKGHDTSVVVAPVPLGNQGQTPSNRP